MSDLITVTYRIARTGQPVPSGGSAPPDYVPWQYAPITWTRIEGDYGPGIVRPRDSLTTRADEAGEGSVWLAPGRYRITLPSRDTRLVTVSPGLGTVDLSALLAGGIEPDDPQYPTLLSQLREDLDAEMAEHMEEIEAGKEAAAQSADDAAQARDAAQGYAEDAQQAAQATAADRLAVAQDRQAIESEQAARLAAIQAAGDTQVSRVVDEGDTQVRIIEGLTTRMVAATGLTNIVDYDTLTGSGGLHGSTTGMGRPWIEVSIVGTASMVRTATGVRSTGNNNSDRHIAYIEGLTAAMVSESANALNPLMTCTLQSPLASARLTMLVLYEDEGHYLMVGRVGSALQAIEVLDGVEQVLASVANIFGVGSLGNSRYRLTMGQRGNGPNRRLYAVVDGAAEGINIQPTHDWAGAHFGIGFRGSQDGWYSRFSDLIIR